MPTIEIVTFPASDAYLTNPKTLDKSLTYLIKREGCINAYHGQQTEDPQTGVLAVVWESYEQQMALKERADLADFVESTKPALDGKPNRINVTTGNDGDSVYTAPISEFAIWKLKEGRTEDEFRPDLVKLAQVLDDAKGTRPPCTWGKCVEDEKTFYVTAGWESMQAHAEAVSPQAVRDFIDAMKEIADLQIFHASLNKFSL